MTRAMRAYSARTRLAFGAATAITAAALADPVVESLANRGAFGVGQFTDHSNADVLPALCVGLLFAAAFIAALTRRMLRPGRSAPGWLRRSVDALPARSVLRLFPAAFAAQIAVLFAMETAEQALTAGHVMGGAIWLGGPLAAALAVHSLACGLVLFSFARLLHWVARGVAEAIILVRRLSVPWPPLAPAALASAYRVAPRRADAPVLRALRGRAPPPPSSR